MTQPTSQPTENEAKKKPAWDDSIRTMIYAVLIAVAFRSFLFEPFHIPSGSMKSNLLVGDYLFVSKYAYGYSRYSFPFGLPLFDGRVMEISEPKRGDVVVFRLPANPKIDFIKRIIGLPGDKVQVRDGLVYLNGAALPRTLISNWLDDEDAAHARTIPQLHETLPEGREITILKEKNGGYANNTPEFTVPAGHYFVMGDNRDNSRDSRFPDEVGFVPLENIVGRAEVIFFSLGGGSSFWQLWNWPDDLRYDRFFQGID